MESSREEIWKPMKSNPNYYISNQGNVCNKNKRPLKLTIKNGYYICLIMKEGKSHCITVSREMLNTFIGMPENIESPVVDHINGNKLDNRLENLEWVTQKENTDRARANGLTKTHERSVVQMDLCENVIKIWSSVQTAATELNINRHSILKCCTKDHKTGGGYKWKYEIENIELNVPFYEGEPIEGYENYLVFKNGVVFSNKSKKPLKPMKNSNGNVYVTLVKDRLKQNKYVHTIVAEKYLTKPTNDSEYIVNHKDGNKLNNCVENLEWMTRSELLSYKFKKSLVLNHSTKEDGGSGENSEVQVKSNE